MINLLDLSFPEDEESYFNDNLSTENITVLRYRIVINISVEYHRGKIITLRHTKM